VAESTSLKYCAFLSYSHSDARWAQWLHSRLEAFRFDGDLIGRPSRFGTVPKTLRPIFRDREDFSGGHTLTDATVAALDASAALIVLCSPVAAERPAVNEEVRLFRSRHATRPVIPVIVGGLWPDNFPPALRFELSAGGIVTDRPVTILGPDLRDTGDGKTLGLAKVVAGLTGLNPDDIFRRAERSRRRRTRFAYGLAAVFLALAVAAGGSAVYAYQKLTESNERLNEAIEIAYGIVTKATAMSDRYGVPQELTLDLLGQAESALNSLIARGADSPMLRRRKALMLINFAYSYKLLGRYDDAMSRIADARTLLVGLTRQDPSNIEWQNELAIAEYKTGDINYFWGHIVEALTNFQASVELFKKYPPKEASSALAFDGEGSAPYYQVWAYSWLSVTQAIAGDSDAALVNVKIARDLADRAAARNSQDPIAVRNQALSHTTFCSILYVRGNYRDAVNDCRVSVAAMKSLVASYSTNTRWQRDLAWAELHLASPLAAIGARAEAFEALQSAVSIGERLVASDTKNILWTWILWTGDYQLAQVALKRGNVDEAYTRCKASAALVEPAALRDPKYYLFRRRLAWSQLCLGDVQKAQSNPEGALNSYRQALEAFTELAQIDSRSVFRKGDLAWGYIKAGVALAAVGRKDDAVADFQKAAAFANEITATDPNSIEWEAALIWSEWRRAEQGDDAQTCVSDVVARLRKLKNEDRLSFDLAALLPGAESMLAKLNGY
jgi:tetratricopeptide (TPR) repeat protein